MNSSTTRSAAGERQIQRLSAELLPQVALLTRLFVRELDGPLSRSEASLLNTLSSGPRRITELAELEGVTQPTMTLLVKRLEQQGLVARARQAHDGRVVMVSVTEAGKAAFADFLAAAGAAMREYLSELDQAQIDALVAALGGLQALIAVLQQR